MIENRVKRVWREGGLALGAYSGCFGTPSMVEIIGHAGYDAVFIDVEHMPFDLHEIHMMVLAVERISITPIVRPPGFDPAFILQLLDMGVSYTNVNPAPEVLLMKSMTQQVADLRKQLL